MKHDEGLHAELPFGHFVPRGFSAAAIGLCHRLPAAWPGARALNRLLRGPLRRGRVRHFDVEIGGLRLRLRTRGNYCEMRQLFEPQFYDVDEINWLCAELADGGCFVDIGGNIGLYSLHIGHRCGPGVRIVTVEPDPALAERMGYLARVNGISIELAQRALSDYAGVGVLSLGAQQRGANTLNTGEGGITVPVTTLQDLCVDYGIDSIRAMKIDIEGHEDRVLNGFFDEAGSTLWPRAIVIEHTHDETRVVHRLRKELGYVQVARTRRNLLLRRDLMPRTG